MPGGPIKTRQIALRISLIKHKLNREIKHPDRYVPPWERPLTGIRIRGGWIDPIEERRYNATNLASGFDIMMYWSSHAKKFRTSEVLQDWWKYAFREDCPERDFSMEEAYTLVKRALLIKGYASQGMVYSEAEDDVKVPATWDDWSTIKQKIIHFNKEYQMALQAKKISKATPAPAPVAKAKVTIKPEPVEGSESTVEVPEGVTVRLTQKAQATIVAARLLLEQQYSDEQIIELVNEEVGYQFELGMIRRRRRMLNEGELEQFGYPAPTEPIEEIGAEPPPAKEVKEPVKASKVAPVPPAKKVLPIFRKTK